jgi:amino acid transporter
MESGRQQEADNDLVQSFLSVRRALGFIGALLPLTLIWYGALWDRGLQPSISGFYHTSAGDLLVGAMVAIAVFLWAYVGYEKVPGEWPSDRLVSRAAALGAAGVALIPTTPAIGMPVRGDPLAYRLFGPDLSRWLHYGSAALFFLMLAVFCLILFRRTAPGSRPEDLSPDKKASNLIYAACGWVILGCIAALLAFSAWHGRIEDAERLRLVDRWGVVFVLETLAVMAFSVSWAVKGRTLRPLKATVARIVT